MKHMALKEGIRHKQNGFTLIELVVALGIMGMVFTLLFSVFYSGIHQGEIEKKEVYLQQEANYVVTALRKAHLNDNQYTISISDSEIVLNGTVISDEFHYNAIIYYNNLKYINPIQNLSIQSNYPVMLEITFTNNGSSYTLRTTLSRGV